MQQQPTNHNQSTNHNGQPGNQNKKASTGFSERAHSLPEALKAEARFLNRRFQAFANELTEAAVELENLRNEVSFLRSGILRAIENEEERLDILVTLRTTRRKGEDGSLIG